MARVPTRINPQTAPAFVARGNLSTPVVDTSLPNLAGLAGDLRVQQNNREQFDLNRALVEETNRRMADFEERKNVADLGAANFAERINSDYGQSDNELVDKYKQLGYSEDNLREFSSRLGALTNKFYGEGIKFQGASALANAGKNADDLNVSLTQYAQNTPDAVGSSLDEWDRNINLLGIDAIEKERLRAPGRNAIIMGAGSGLAMQRPLDVIKALDPQSLAPGGLHTAGRSSNEWANVAVDVANNFGMNPLDVAAVMSYETGGTFDPKVMGGKGGQYMGLIQFSPDNRAKYGITADSTPEQWTAAITKYMTDRGFKRGMDLEDFYSTINAGAPGRPNASDGNGTVRSHTNKIVKEHYANAERWVGQLEGGDTQQVQTAVPVSALPPVQPAVAGTLPLQVTQIAHNDDGSVSTVRTISIGEDDKEVLIPTVVNNKVVSDEEAIRHYRQTGENFGKFNSVADADKYAEWLHESHEAQLAGKPSVTTGIPALDLMDANQRLQILNMARGRKNDLDSEARAQAQQAVENEVTARSTTGNYAGETYSEGELQALFGATKGSSIYATLTGWREASPFIAGLKTANATQAAAQVEALRPRDTAAPNFSDQQKVYEAAQQALAANLRQREEDPRAYVASAFPQVQQAVASAQTSAQRKAGYQAVANAYRQLGIPADKWSPISKDQADALANQYEGQSPNAKLQQLTSWLIEMRGTGLFNPFMDQMSQHGAKSIGGDVYMVSQFAQHPQGNAAMIDILNGNSIIKEDPARKPPPEAVNKAFAGQLAQTINGLNPTASRYYNDMAAAMYVSAGGRVDRGQITDTNLYLKSLRRAVGGLMDNDNTGFAFLHGRSMPATILPPAVTKDRWNSWLTGLTPGALTAISNEKLPPLNKFGHRVTLEDIIDEGTFVMRAAGQYAILGEDGKPLVTGSGREFRVNISRDTIR